MTSGHIPIGVCSDQQFHDRLVYIFHQTSSLTPRFRPHWGQKRYEKNCQTALTNPFAVMVFFQTGT